MKKISVSLDNELYEYLRKNNSIVSKAVREAVLFYKNYGERTANIESSLEDIISMIQNKSVV